MAETHAHGADVPELPREVVYRQWLGIASLVPTHYELLGLPQLETEPPAIQSAARRVKRKLRAYQIGRYRRQALAVLAEVGQAVSVLTNPDKKRAYDNDLVRRWRATAEELYRVHGEGEGPSESAVEAWLVACHLRGVPVARLMPYLARLLEARVEGWRPHGECRCGLPINLWLYRDAVILGRCLHVGALEQRIEAVKGIQKLLEVPEDLARLMAEEVSRSLHLFGHSRIVLEARRDPSAVLVRLGRRIYRYGGHLGRRSKVLMAVAILLGGHKKILEQAFQRLQEPPVDLSAAQAARVAARRAQRRVRAAPRALVTYVAGRPQLLIAAGVFVGAVVLVAALLVAMGIWHPWEPSAGSLPYPPAAEPDVTARPAEPAAPPANGSVDGIEKFIRKYPAEEKPEGAIKKFIQKYPAEEKPPLREPR